MRLQSATSDLMTVLGENWMLVVVGVLFALVLGCLIGYLVGNTSLMSKVTAGIDGLEREKQIQKAGISVYRSFCTGYEDAASDVPEL